MSFKSKSKSHVDHTSWNSLPRAPSAVGVGHGLQHPDYSSCTDSGLIHKGRGGLGKRTESTLGNTYGSSLKE